MGQQVFTDQITTPLGMASTSFTIDATQLPRFAECSTAIPTGAAGAQIVSQMEANNEPADKLQKLQAALETQNKQYVPTDLFSPTGTGTADESSIFLDTGKHVQCPSGGGGILSTVNDYAKFANTLLTGTDPHTGYKMLELASVELMRTEQLGPMGVPRTGMAAMFQGIGLGVNTTIDPEQPNYYRGAARGAGGWGGAAATSFFVDPQREICWVQASQLLNYASTVSSFRSELSEHVHGLFGDLDNREVIAGPDKVGFAG